MELRNSNVPGPRALKLSKMNPLTDEPCIIQVVSQSIVNPSFVTVMALITLVCVN